MKKLLSLLLTALIALSLSATVFATESEIATDSSWEITASSELVKGSILNAFDSDAETFWHTSYISEDGKVTSFDKCPHTVTVNFGKKMTVSGFKYTPRTNNGSGTFRKFNIYASDDGKTFKLIYTGSFDYGTVASENKPKTVSWGDASMQAVMIEVTETLGGYGTAAEINFLTGGTGTAIKDGAEYIDPKDRVAEIPGTALKTDASWKISASSELGKGSIVNAFDSDTSSFWHTAYTSEDGKILSHDEAPFEIIVDFGKETAVSGWLYTPRTIGSATGTFLKYNMYKSSDGKSFEKFYSGSFNYGTVASNNMPDGASWGDIKMRCIKIEVTEGISGYGTAAEIGFYTGGEKIEKQAEISTDSRSAADGTKFYGRTGWKVEVNSIGYGKVENVLDGDLTTYWHSAFSTENGQVSTHDNPPYHLIVTLPDAVATSGIVMTPRTDSVNGQIFSADIYASDSDDGEWVLLASEYEFKNEASVVTEIPFNKNLRVKRVWIEVLSTHGGYGTLSEFDLMVKKDDLETAELSELEEGEAIYQLYQVPTDEATAECDAPFWVGDASWAIDGNATKWFQTEEIAKPDWPVVITIDLKDVYTIKEIQVAPRGSADCHGQWLRVSVYASTDDNEWFALKEDLEFPENSKSRLITLDAETAVRYVEFQIEEAVANRVSCGEITFWQSKAAKENDKKDASERYILKVGSKEIISQIDGEESVREIDVAPIIVKGSTLIPLRGLLEEMGAEVSWDGATETVTVDNGKNVIKLNIWNRLVYVYGTEWGDLRYTLLNPPIIMDSRTLIPVRFVSEQLGYNVSWDGEAQTITIDK